ncbi:MAG: hypothetical protein K8T91_10720, partial [Planctomycetes bacterium]|nr:hypothetical protein [Planctomycetota bacterium]
SIARWIDLLVAHVHENAQQASVAKLPTTAQATNHDTGIDVCPLAIDPDRARDFADDLAHQRSAGLHGRAAALAIGSLRATLGDQLSAASPNADLNHALATSIVACFAPGLFESTGVYRSLWTQRLANHSADVEGLIGDLVAMEF